MINTEEFLAILQKECKEAGSTHAWAVSKGLHNAIVSEVLRGVRPVPVSIALALGYRRSFSFELMEKK